MLPIVLLVFFLHFTISPLPLGTLFLFLASAVLLILGMGLFTLGADVAMMPMGEGIGSELTKSRNLPLILGTAFVLGTLITLAEPDLQVLARQVPSIPDLTLVVFVSLGVGVFLVIALLRILLQIRLSLLLFVVYAFLFVLAYFSQESFLPVAFDSGGVTTGPITVPFILSFGVGIASVRGGRSSQDDSFGLVALCSIGPIMAVMLLGLFYQPSAAVEDTFTTQIGGVFDFLAIFADQLPHYFKEVTLALAPIILFFAFFQMRVLRFPKSQMIKIAIGVLYTYVGLALFLTAANVGFIPVGLFYGEAVASLEASWLLIPLGLIMGAFVVAAEPAVHVLNKQVEEISGGAISKNVMLFTLAIGVGISVALAMTRLLTGVGIWIYLLIGYILALLLTRFVPAFFTGIAFDSGGVASGPMTATFMLAFSMGASNALGGDLMTDAFGLVAMVAMTPLIAIQILGLIYTMKVKAAEAKVESLADESPIELMSEEEIIEAGGYED